jgi:hypothetical protein
VRHLSRWVAIGLTSTLAIPVWAATLVERQDAQGKTEKLTVSEDYARVDTSRQGFYTLIDFKQDKMFLVHAKKKEIVERSLKPVSPPAPPEGMPLPPEKPVGDVQLVEKGEGPEIAGYTTTHYQITADGEVCADSYLSASAAEVTHLKGFLKVMEEMAMPPKDMITRMPACAQAQFKLKADFFDKGLPLRSVNKEGKVTYEITSIKTDVDVPTDTFKLPDGYEVMTEEGMRKKMEEMMRQHKGDHQMMPPPGMQPNMPMRPQGSNTTD